MANNGSFYKITIFVPILFVRGGSLPPATTLATPLGRSRRILTGNW